ncbi:MAG: hypothetical protein VKK04_19750 [Synechococcales bacterium]|nr:hypothetical protein [Synechococcales bacterium]
MARTRRKRCDRCLNEFPVLFRVQYDDSRQWYFVCDRCLPQVKEGNPQYTYGGTWKAEKRH